MISGNNLLIFNIRRIRKEKKITQEKLEELTGIKQSALSKYERGTVIPGTEILNRIAKGLGVSVTKFYEPIPKGEYQTPPQTTKYNVEDEGVSYDVSNAQLRKEIQENRELLEEINKKLDRLTGSEQDIF